MEIARHENEILKREFKELEKALEEKENKVLIFHIFFCYMHTNSSVARILLRGGQSDDTIFRGS